MCKRSFVRLVHVMIVHFLLPVELEVGPLMVLMNVIEHKH